MSIIVMENVSRFSSKVSFFVSILSQYPKDSLESFLKSIPLQIMEFEFPSIGLNLLRILIIDNRTKSRGDPI